MSTIYELTYGYLKEKDHFLLIDRATGILRDELHPIQIKMIEYNEIPKLLPIEIEETDLRIKFRYILNDKVQLPVFIKSHPLSTHKVYQLLFTILSIIEDSSLYMLNEENYILDIQFIYIGDYFNDVFLTYLPLKKITGKQSFQHEFLDLVEKLLNLTRESLDREMNEFLQRLHNEDLSIAELKKYLVELIDKKGKEGNQVHSSFIKHEKNKKNEVDLDHRIKAKNTIKELTNQQKNIVYIISFFVIALIWRFYIDFPKQGMLYIAIGLTILVIDLAFILTTLWRPPLFQKQKETSKKKKEDSNIHETILLSQRTPAEIDISNQNDPVNKQTAHLEINRDARIEKIEINKDSFLIGRNPAVVDYIEDALEISKVHVELKLTNGGYMLRDLASKNGTYINEEKLTPNKVYFIKDGDVIKIAKQEYIFRVVRK